ncbi:hypothetical protein HZH68_012239 [Vespula germanica]|uniref:Uncharacterized protein n=2 Tax=Vespula TaxID=7451 RepID=A0A834JI32_VESGE|nr:hypothetical protein HZH68_012239 [Vespula germanica]KAF7410644.1 hypothetical protein H0235_013251 [Vespula pensylvanica]
MWPAVMTNGKGAGDGGHRATPWHDAFFANGLGAIHPLPDHTAPEITPIFSSYFPPITLDIVSICRIYEEERSFEDELREESGITIAGIGKWVKEEKEVEEEKEEERSVAKLRRVVPK